MKPKLRVWVVFGKQLKLGDGRAQLLSLIDTRGSLRQAAAELDMSYRNAWGYLRELEKAAGFKFVERAAGGSPRDGLRLTGPGRAFLACYQRFHRALDAAARRQFERCFKGQSVTLRAAVGDRPGRSPRRPRAEPPPRGRARRGRG